MYQFFVKPEQIQGDTVRIEGGDVNHIKNVLRMKIGEEIAVSNGEDAKEYHCKVERFDEDEVICTVLSVREDTAELPSRIFLFQGLPKGDKMELIIQKAVELGVYAVIPVSTKRCVVKLDAKKEKSKIARWQQIAEAAAKQSKRSIIPEIRNVMSLKEALRSASAMDVKLFPYEHAEGMNRTRRLIEQVKAGCDIAVFVGPEGGLEETEVEMAEGEGFEAITLGSRILRTETAGFTVISWLMYQLEGCRDESVTDGL